MKKLILFIANLLLFFSFSPSKIIGQTNFNLLHPPYNSSKTAFVGPPYWTYTSANQYYKIDDSAFDSWVGTIDNAFQVWNNVSVVQFVRSTSVGLSLFTYYDENDKIGSIINPGKARVDGVNNKINTSMCNIRINRRHQWTNGTMDAQNNILDLKSILVHEIGHILGIDQAYEMGSNAPTMSGWNNPSFWTGTEMGTLEQYDKNAANFLQTLVPTLYTDLQAAVNVAQQIGIGWVIIESQYSLPNNVILPSNVHLVINPSVTFSLNNNYILASNSSVRIESGAAINGVKAYIRNGSTIIGCFPEIQTALNNTSSGNTVELLESLTLSGNITIPQGVTLKIMPSVSVALNGFSISGGTILLDGATVSDLQAYHKLSGAIKGLFPSVQSAIESAGSGKTVELLATTYSISPSISSKSNIALTGQGSSTTIINGGISISNSINIDISGLRVTGTVSASNSQYVYVSNCNIPSSTMLQNYYSTSTNLGFSTSGTEEQASFAVTSYGGTGNIFYNTIRRFDCGIYLTSGASFNVGDGNTFCNNGVDIVAENVAYAYAISNNYSYALPNSVYGNVFTTGTNGVCSLSKTSALQQQTITSSDSKLLKDADDKYLALLRKIDDDSKKEKYDKSKYETTYSKLIDDYKNVILVEKDKKIVKAALTKLNYLYKSKEDQNAFSVYLNDLASEKNNTQYLPYIQRF